MEVKAVLDEELEQIANKLRSLSDEELIQIANKLKSLPDEEINETIIDKTISNVIKAKDTLIASGYSEGEEDFISLLTGKKETSKKAE